MMCLNLASEIIFILKFGKRLGDLKLSIWDINVIEPEASGHTVRWKPRGRPTTILRIMHAPYSMMGVPSPVFGVSRLPLSETTLEPHTCKELLEMLAYLVNQPMPKAMRLPDVSHALYAMLA